MTFDPENFFFRSGDCEIVDPMPGQFANWAEYIGWLMKGEAFYGKERVKNAILTMYPADTAARVIEKLRTKDNKDISGAEVTA